MTNLLLFIGDRQCRVAIWNNGLLHAQAAFPNSEAGRRLFEYYLDKTRKPVVSILVDLVEEDYRVESFPGLKGRDRRNFHAKKLEQYYRYTPLRNARFQVRKGANDRVLFSALTSPNLVMPWIESMSKKRISVSGVYSVAMLSDRFIGRIPASHLLLLSIQNGTGLRQSFFLDGHLNFSRLTPIHPGEDLVAVAQTESDRLYKYLYTQSLIPESGALMVCILCGGADRKNLEKTLEDTSSIHHVYFDIREAALRIGYRGNIEGSDALPLFLHVLGKEPGENQYGSAEHTHIFDLQQWHRFAAAMSAALVLFGGIWFGIDLFRAFGLHNRARVLVARTDSVMIQYRQLFPSDSITGSPQEMKAAVMLYEKISSSVSRPGDILIRVSHALDAAPDIRIGRLSWQAAKNPEALNAVSGEIKDGTDYLDTGPVYQAIFIEGEILPFGGDYRRANETVDRFCAELEKNGMNVTKIRRPLDLDPETSFTGKPGQTGERAAFSLKAIWKGHRETGP